MRYGRRTIGPRFGDKMGTLCSVALTQANKNNYEGYRAAIEELYQMIDTIAEEAGFEQHYAGSENENEAAVAAVAERAEGGAGSEAPPDSGASVRERAGRKVPSKKRGA